MAKSTKKKKDNGVVFDTEQSKISATDIKKTFEHLSYDPHDLTEKIMMFGKALTGIPLYGYQEQFCYRVIFAVITFENEVLTALWSRQSGKSESMAFVIDTLMVILPAISSYYKEFKQFERGFKIGLYAPQQLQVDTTYERAMDRLSSENAELILEDPGIDTGLTSAKYLGLTNGSSTTGQVASKSSKIESKTYHLIILEESQDMDDFVVQKSIEPMTSATGGTILKVGTTGTVKNHFWSEIQDNRKKNRLQKDPRLFYHFEFDYLKVIEYKRKQYEVDGNAFHLHYEKDVLKKRSKWGSDSDAFKLGYGLIWPLESGMFITDAAFDKICNKKLGIPNEIQDDWLVAAGLDFGKDNDSTVLTLCRVFYPEEEYTTEPPTKQIIGWLEISLDSYDSQHYDILDALIAYNVQILYCDYTGVGKGPTDRLMAACGDSVMIVPYTFSKPSKSDMYLALDTDIRAGRLVVPANKVVREKKEFINFETQLKGLQKWFDGGYMVCSHGSGMGEHDDYPDSLALMTMAGNHELPQDIEIEEENVFFNDMHKVSGTGITHRNAHW